MTSLLFSGVPHNKHTKKKTTKPQNCYLLYRFLRLCIREHFNYLQSGHRCQIEICQFQGCSSPPKKPAIKKPVYILIKNV